MPILCILMETCKGHNPGLPTYTYWYVHSNTQTCLLCFYIINEISRAIVYDIPQGRTLFACGYSFTRLQYTYQAPLYGGLDRIPLLTVILKIYHSSSISKCTTSLRYGWLLWTETQGRWWRRNTCPQTLSFVSIMPMPMKTKVIDQLGFAK